MFLPSVLGLVEFLPMFFPSSRCTRGSMWLLGGAWSWQEDGEQERELHDFNSWFFLPLLLSPCSSVQVIHPGHAL